MIVKTGIQDNQYIEIVEGLKDGDKVIVEPFTAIQQVLKDNQEIKVVSKEELLEEK